MKKTNLNKFNSKIARLIICTITFSLCNIGNATKDNIAHATELSVTDQNRMLGATAQDWKSSNLREWLNSNKSTVDYTAIAPSYKSESGFLSATNFTQMEYDNIAVTRDSQSWQYSIGNVARTPFISQKSVVHNDYSSNDKVFILNYSDIYNYIERNDLLLDYNTKYYSNYLQSEPSPPKQTKFAIEGASFL